MKFEKFSSSKNIERTEDSSENAQNYSRMHSFDSLTNYPIEHTSIRKPEKQLISDIDQVWIRENEVREIKAHLYDLFNNKTDTLTSNTATNPEESLENQFLQKTQRPEVTAVESAEESAKADKVITESPDKDNTNKPEEKVHKMHPDLSATGHLYEDLFPQDKKEYPSLIVEKINQKKANFDALFANEQNENFSNKDAISQFLAIKHLNETMSDIRGYVGRFESNLLEQETFANRLQQPLPSRYNLMSNINKWSDAFNNNFEDAAFNPTEASKDQINSRDPITGDNIFLATANLHNSGEDSSSLSRILKEFDFNKLVDRKEDRKNKNKVSYKFDFSPNILLEENNDGVSAIDVVLQGGDIKTIADIEDFAEKLSHNELIDKCNTSEMGKGLLENIHNKELIYLSKETTAFPKIFNHLTNNEQALDDLSIVDIASAAKNMQNVDRRELVLHLIERKVDKERQYIKDNPDALDNNQRKTKLEADIDSLSALFPDLGY